VQTRVCNLRMRRVNMALGTVLIEKAHMCAEQPRAGNTLSPKRDADVLFETKREKEEAVVQEIRRVHRTGRPF